MKKIIRRAVAQQEEEKPVARKILKRRPVATVVEEDHTDEIPRRKLIVRAKATVRDEAPFSQKAEQDIPDFFDDVPATEVQSIKPDNQAIAEKAAATHKALMDALLDRMKAGHTNWRPAKWASFLEGIYAMPVGIIDVDRLILVLYGKMYIEKFQANGGEIVSELAAPPTPEDMAIMNYDHTAPPAPKIVVAPLTFDANFVPNAAPQVGGITPEQVAAQKAMLDAATIETAPVVETKAAVIEALKKEDVLANGGRIVNTEQAAATLANLEAIRDNADNPIRQKWAIAEAIAKNPSQDAGGIPDDDVVLATMVKWIQHGLSANMQLPPMPDNVVDIYWPIPRVIDKSEKVSARRKEMIERICSMWADVVAKNAEKMTLEFDSLSQFTEPVNIADYYDAFDYFLREHRDRCSYRMVQAAIQLQKAVEDFALAGRLDGYPDRPDEDQLLTAVKTALKEYYKSFLPLKAEVGPRELVDPDYLTYRHVVRKYNLPVGCFLHDQLQQMQGQ